MLHHVEVVGARRHVAEGEPPIFAGTEFRWRVHERPLPEPGATLLLCTDGLLEAEAGDGDEFGEERLTCAVWSGERGAGDAPAEDAATHLDAAFAAVDAHRRGAPQADDYTAALVTFGD